MEAFVFFFFSNLKIGREEIEVAEADVNMDGDNGEVLQARERPMLVMVEVLPMPPLPEVMMATQGVEPESSSLQFRWRRDRRRGE